MKCRDCMHYAPADASMGVCLRQRMDHPEHPEFGTSYGLAFAHEGSADPADLDCDMAEPRGRSGSAGDR